MSTSVLVIVPTYNESENLERIVTRLFAAVPDAHALIVDDASPDGTGKLADELAESEPRLHVLHRALQAHLRVPVLQLGRRRGERERTRNQDKQGSGEANRHERSRDQIGRRMRGRCGCASPRRVSG